jgi:hypothetical protein
MTFAVTGALTDDDVRPFGVLLFLVGVLVWHDLLLTPLMLALGALISRRVPATVRAVVRVAALCSAALLVVGVPLVLGPGRDRPYLLGLVLTLMALWAATLGVVAARHKRSERASTTAPGPARRTAAPDRPL